MDMDKDHGGKGMTGITPEDALELCLVQMENGTGLPLGAGVRKKVSDSAIEKFKKYHSEWPQLGSKVVRAARKVGEYSEEFARFDAEINGTQPTVVTLEHVREAIHAVSKFCPARAFLGAEARFKWCPEP